MYVLMQKLEFITIALVVLFMLVAVAGKVKMNVLDRSGDIGQEANTVVPYTDIRGQ